MKFKIATTAAVLVVLAGCDPTISSDPITGSIFSAPPPATTAPLDATTPAATTTTPEGAMPVEPAADPALSMVEDTTSGGGLLAREPDTCKVGEYTYLRGQTATEVQGAGITRPYRVIGPSDIVTQEYNPMRVNFYTDGSGRIGRVSCG